MRTTRQVLEDAYAEVLIAQKKLNFASRDLADKGMKLSSLDAAIAKVGETLLRIDLKRDHGLPAEEMEDAPA